MKVFGRMMCACVVAAALAGCDSGQGEQSAKATDSASETNGLPAALMLAAMPSNVRGVAETKDAVQAGDEVAIRGRIGGSSEPFVDGRAAFTIVDNGLKACSDVPGDMCPQPWDYCCETRDSLARNTATISIVREDGKPVAMSMNGVQGLKELTDVVVVGKVAQAEGNVLLVHASGIYIAAP